ncbi:MAG: hypothetical protein JWP52_1781 [Rhizobacter sp.]|nr:hypothetical protein [Rhizobacter sp.]
MMTDPPPQDTAPDSRLLATLAEGMWKRDLLTGKAWYSHRYKELLGFSDPELPNDSTHFRDRIHPDDHAMVERLYAQAASLFEVVSIQARMLHRDGSWRWFRARVRIWPGPDGQPVLLTGSISDVHDETHNNRELALMTGRFERALLASDAGLFERIVGEDAMFISARFCELLGHTPGELPHRYSHLSSLVHPDDLPHREAAQASGTSRKGRWSIGIRMRCRNGEFRWFSERCIALQNDANGPVIVSGVLQDIHEQRLLEQALRRERNSLEAEVRGLSVITPATSAGPSFDWTATPLKVTDRRSEPAAVGNATATATDSTARPAASQRSTTVLVVDDNMINQIVAREMVSALGGHVALADSGEDALLFCQDTPPGLVLMDIQMPGMGGLECTRRLRRLQGERKLPTFPIIALTAHASPADRTASLEAGMDEHLTKPIQLERLQLVLSQWLPLRRRPA